MFSATHFCNTPSIEYSENNIIEQSGMFVNEIEPGVPQYSVRQTRAPQEYQR